jgi:hypothetical protein
MCFIFFEATRTVTCAILVILGNYGLGSDEGHANITSNCTGEDVFITCMHNNNNNSNNSISNSNNK